MKFPYKRFSSQIIRPVIPITIRAGDRTVRYEVLLDSGADICLFDWDIAELLGLDLRGGRVELATGIGGQVAGYMVHPVELGVGGQFFETPVGFMKSFSSSNSYGVVGQLGFSGHFTLVGNSKPNASVSQRQAGVSPAYHLTEGMVIALLDMCMETACTKEFLPHIPGASDVMVGINSNQQGRFVEYRHYNANSHPLDLLARVPRSFERQGVGWMLFALASRFISLHEQGHYLHAHLKMLPGGSLMELQDNPLSLAVLPWKRKRKPKLEPADLQAFELQADSFALINGAGIAFRDWDTESNSPEFRAISANFPEWCMNSFLGSALVGLLMSEASLCQTGLRTHPSPACRLYGLMLMITDIRSKFKERTNEAEWVTAIEKAFAGLQGALQSVSAQTALSVGSVLDCFSNGKEHPAKDEYRALGLRLQALSSKLNQFVLDIETEIGGPILDESAQE